MKDFVFFELSKKDYVSKNFSSHEMCNLGCFFSTDYYVYGYDFLMNWANDPSQDYTHANITYLEKKDGVICVGDLYEKEPIVTFDISLEKFIKLINDWGRVSKERPQKITITREGDKITVEGVG